ncbi:MAG: TVP38/TMEM64 family protein [Pseudomonadota bacterium]
MPTDRTTDAPDTDSTSGSALMRYLPIAVIAVGAIAAFVLLRDYLGFQALTENYQALLDWRAENAVLAIAAFMLAYVVAVAFSIPGAVWLSLIGGLLFGTVGGSAMVVIAATIGATLVFLAAKTAFGEVLRARASGWITKMETGFRDGQISFLLIMRLVPAVPFFVANLAPAFLGARTWTFVWTTLVGIIPGTVVYVSIGAGLGEQLARGEQPDLGVIFEPHVLGPLLGLAALAALPLVLKSLGVIGQKDPSQ